MYDYIYLFYFYFFPRTMDRVVIGSSIEMILEINACQLGYTRKYSTARIPENPDFLLTQRLSE